MRRLRGRGDQIAVSGVGRRCGLGVSDFAVGLGRRGRLAMAF